MEFPNLGENCQIQGCNQTDFLPFQCKCSLICCREHYNEHCLSGACELSSKANPVNLIANDKFYKCTSTGCKLTTLHEFLCPKCGKHFCISHRFHPECPEIDENYRQSEIKKIEEKKQKFTDANLDIQNKITEKIRKALQTPKAKTAAKIHLMRVKQKAIGPKTIPVGDRIYFSVTLPKTTKAKAVNVVYSKEGLQNVDLKNLDVDFQNIISVFVSKNYTLGRNFDIICDSCQIINKNNQQNDIKLRLFRYMDGYCLKQLDLPLNEILKDEILVEGDRLLIEYLDVNDLKMLNDSTEFLLKIPIVEK